MTPLTVVFISIFWAWATSVVRLRFEYFVLIADDEGRAGADAELVEHADIVNAQGRVAGTVTCIDGGRCGHPLGLLRLGSTTGGGGGAISSALMPDG